MQQANQQSFSRLAIDAAIKIGIIFILVIWCFEIIKPFVLIIVWGGVIAVALYPVVVKLSKKMKLSLGRTSSLVTLFIVALLIIPSIGFSGALIDST